MDWPMYEEPINFKKGMIPENGRKVNKRPSSGIISRILILFSTMELYLQYIFQKGRLKVL
jgi:hypothetical protein